MPAGATMRLTMIAAVLCALLSGCHGIDLGDNPSPDTGKQTGPLVVPPAHLKNGAVE